MLSPEDAWLRIAAEIDRLEVVEIDRSKAGGRVLGRDVEAQIDVPGSDVSAMDGYALCTASEAGTTFEVVGTLAAGASPGFDLAPGKAVRIMTGATVPTTADRVVPIENTDRGLERVHIEQMPAAGSHIRRQAEVLRRGRLLLPNGSFLTPGALGLLATHGFSTVPAVREPSVSIITTGDEVVSPEQTPKPGQLRDSHTDFLTAATRASTSRVEALGIVPDDRDVLRERVTAGLEADVLLLSGGVSMGEFDLVEGVLAEAGCRFLFDSVAIQPGKPLVAARHDGGLVFGLPGNPASAMVGFWLFVRPTLRLLQGIDDGFWHGALSARATEPLPTARGRDLFVPARVRFADGEIFVDALQPRGSHDLSAYGRGTAIARIPAGSSGGERCEILPLGNWIAA